MVFKAVGVILLLLAAYLVFQAFLALSPNDGSRTLVSSLTAIFLVLVVRVLQAEKHHREGARNHLQRLPDGVCRQQDSEQAHILHAQGEPWLGR